MRLFPFEHKALPLIPVPGLLIEARASEPDLVRQVLARELQQQLADSTAMIFRRDEQLVEAAVSKAEREHRCDPSGVVRNIKAPAVRDLPWDARAQIGEQLLTWCFQADREPALSPDAGDLVVLAFERLSYRQSLHESIRSLFNMSAIP